MVNFDLDGPMLENTTRAKWCKVPEKLLSRAESDESRIGAISFLFF